MFKEKYTKVTEVHRKRVNKVERRNAPDLRCGGNPVCSRWSSGRAGRSSTGACSRLLPEFVAHNYSEDPDRPGQTDELAVAAARACPTGDEFNSCGETNVL